MTLFTLIKEIESCNDINHFLVHNISQKMIVSTILLLSFKIDRTSSRRELNMNKNEFIDNNSHYMKFIVFILILKYEK